MAERIQYRFNDQACETVILDDAETIANQCSPGDAAVVPSADGWWICFVGAHGDLCWEGTLDSAEEAVEIINAA